MSRKVRERAEMAKFGAIQSEFGIKLAEPMSIFAYYAALVDHFSPIVMRSAKERLDEAWTKIFETVETEIAEGQEIKVEDLMRDAGLDPAIRSDKARTQRFLKDSGLVQIIKAHPEQMVKRLAKGNGKTEASGETPV